MHLVDMSRQHMSPRRRLRNPDSVRYALAVNMRGENRIVVCFFGEGAADEGVTQESLNFAALRRLPILFVCENNEYANYSHVSARLAGYGLCERYRALGVPCEKEESGDFLAMHEAAGRGIADVRRGLGPRFIELKTARWLDQVGPDEDRHHGHRSDVRLNAAIAGDQLARIGRLLPDGTRRDIADAVESEIPKPSHREASLPRR